MGEEEPAKARAGKRHVGRNLEVEVVVAEDAEEDAEDEALNKLRGNLFLVAAARARPTELVVLMLKRLNETLRRECGKKELQG